MLTGKEWKITVDPVGLCSRVTGRAMFSWCGRIGEKNENYLRMFFYVTVSALYLAISPVRTLCR